MADGTNNDGDFFEQHKIENNEKEIEKPNAAIEHFDSNQEAVKKKLNELPSEIDDDLEVEETGQKMYEVMNDSEMEDDVQKHLNQCWLDHHLYLSQLSSDGSDLDLGNDLGNSENDEDLKIKKLSDLENQGTTANAEFTDQNRSDKVEDEITSKISELSPLVQDKSEKNKEENEKLTAAIEQFDSDQESFKKKLNELSSEFDDNLKNVDLEVEETEQKMTGMFNDSKRANDVEKHLDQLRMKFDFQFQSSSDDGSHLDIENSENVEDYVGNLKIKKQSDQENQGTIANAEFIDQDRNEKIEDEIPAKKSKLSPIVKTFDQKRSKFNRLAREVKDELAWMTRVKEERDAKFQQSKFKLAKLKQRNSDMEMKVFELFKNRIRIIMEQPADHELRDKIKSWLESQTEKAETKMESTQTQIEGRTKHLRRRLRIWKCCDGSDLDLGKSENVGDLKLKKQSDPENQDQKQKMGLDKESVALKLILDDLETEIPRLQVHLARLTQQKEELVEMFQQLEFELEKQKQKNSDMKMEKPADHELRDKIKSGLESEPKKPKTKMESTLNQILSGAKDSRRCLRIWKCWDAVKTLK